MRTRNKMRTHYFIDKIGEPYEMECENILAGTAELGNGVVGNFMFDSNTILIVPEQPSLVLFRTQGIMYMADPNHFGGETMHFCRQLGEFGVTLESVKKDTLTELFEVMGKTVVDSEKVRPNSHPPA